MNKNYSLELVFLIIKVFLFYNYNNISIYISTYLTYKEFTNNFGDINNFNIQGLEKKND
jgi:hypothetical protein